MALTFKLIRPLPALNLAELSRTLRAAVDPAVELREFQAAVRGVARARQNELNATSDDFRFALDDLLPTRVRGIERHLVRRSVNATEFAAFVRNLARIAQESVPAHDDVDEVAEVVAAVVDDLHAYVLEHGLVGAGYLIAERELARRLVDGADLVDQIDHAHAADHDLVLAA